MKILAFTFNDIFRKPFLDSWGSQQPSVTAAVVSLLLATLIALYVFFVYRLVTRKTFYLRNFNISLVGIALITCAIILTIQSNIVISLGMVGALSIVRFRTAVKNPMDLMFLFWALGVGIICGAGHAFYAVALSLLLTLVILLLDWLPAVQAPMILVVNAADPRAEGRIMDTVRSHCRRAEVKARNTTAATLAITVELRQPDAELLTCVQDVPGVTAASLVDHTGETTL